MERRRRADRAAASDHDDLCVLAFCGHGVPNFCLVPHFVVDRTANSGDLKLGLIYSELYETGNLSGGRLSMTDPWLATMA